MFKPEWYLPPSLGEDDARDPDIYGLENMVDAFAEEMKTKLRTKYAEGYRGWENPDLLPHLRAKLKAHAYKPGDQSVDIANLAAMIWNIETDPTPTY